MDMEREELKIRVSMIERAYRKDMKKLEKVQTRIKLDKQEDLSQGLQSSRSVDKVIIKSKPSPEKESDPKAPSYTKIALKRRKYNKSKEVENPGERPKKDHSYATMQSPDNWSRIKKLSRMNEAGQKSKKGSSSVDGRIKPTVTGISANKINLNLVEEIKQSDSTDEEPSANLEIKTSGPPA